MMVMYSQLQFPTCCHPERRPHACYIGFRITPSPCVPRSACHKHEDQVCSRCELKRRTPQRREWSSINASVLHAALTRARGAPTAARVRALGTGCLTPPREAVTPAFPSAAVRNCACDFSPAAPSSARQRHTRIRTQAVLAVCYTGRRRKGRKGVRPTHVWYRRPSLTHTDARPGHRQPRACGRRL